MTEATEAFKPPCHDVPNNLPPVCPFCGATADDRCRFDRSNEAVVMLLEENRHLRARIKRAQEALRDV